MFIFSNREQKLKDFPYRYLNALLHHVNSNKFQHIVIVWSLIFSYYIYCDIYWKGHIAFLTTEVSYIDWSSEIPSEFFQNNPLFKCLWDKF